MMVKVYFEMHRTCIMLILITPHLDKYILYYKFVYTMFGNFGQVTLSLSRLFLKAEIATERQK